jgi:hypothetical protein
VTPVSRTGGNFWEAASEGHHSPVSSGVFNSTVDFNSPLNANADLNSIQVGAVVHDMNGPLPEQNFSSRISTTSSRRDEMTARNEVLSIVSESNANLEEEQAIMEAIEASEAAQAKLNGVRRKNEIEKRRLEVQASLWESIAQIDNEVNEARLVHGMDVAGVSRWVGETSPEIIVPSEIPITNNSCIHSSSTIGG